MSLARPTVSEERWLALAARYPQAREAVRAGGATGPWRCATMLTRCLFFALGLFAAGFTYSILKLLQMPAPGLVAGLAVLATAEWLITRRRMHASGIEEVLWAAGAVMMMFDLSEGIGGLDDSLVLALCAAALGIAGWRLLNPLFTTLAALLASSAVTMLSGFSMFDERAALAGQLCFALAFLALASGARTFHRPAFDRMLDWLVVTLPAFGYFWTLWDRGGAFTFAALREGDPSRMLPALLLLTYGLVALATGIRRRTHAPLVAALVSAVLLATELRAVTGPLEWRLICWGGVGLLAALALERWLRRPRDGITSRDLEETTTALELLQMGGAAVSMPEGNAGSAGPAPAQTTGGGGEFGGGGASGRF